MKMPVLIFRAGKRSAVRNFACLLVLALLLTFSVRLYRTHAQEQESMEVFAGGEGIPAKPQGLYALLGKLIGE